MAKNEAVSNDKMTDATHDALAIESAKEPVKTVAAKPASADACASGFYCYIGPTIYGVIHHGDLFFGTRAKALEQAKAAIEKQPLVKTLIVAGDDLPTARLKVKTPGNVLYNNGRRIAGKA